jgi:hypothetical protein
MDDIVLNKVASIERCLFRIAEEYEDTPANLEHDLTRAPRSAGRARDWGRVGICA